MIQLPAAKKRTGHVPAVTLPVRAQNERAFASAYEYLLPRSSATPSAKLCSFADLRAFAPMVRLIRIPLIVDWGGCQSTSVAQE